jgi:Ca2+-binding RTX toxin-like protein
MLSSQALQLLQQYLARFAATDDFEEKIESIFVTRIGSLGIRQQWLSGDFSLIPDIRILANGELGTANGAYAADLDEILVSADFLGRHQDDPVAVAGLLLEELGHKIDRVLNGNVDSPGDEGAIFRSLVTGQTVSDEILAGLRAKDDRSVIVLDDKAVEIEKQDFFGDAGGIVTNDSIVGTAGDDTISPGLGRDNVNGGDGTDTLIIDYSANDYTGSSSKGLNSSIFSGSGNGSISVYKGTGDDSDQVTYFNIEQLNVTGTKYDDTIQGGIGNDILKGGAGNDRLIGNGGVDILDGGDGIDSVVIDLSSSSGNNNLDFTQAITTAVNGTQFKSIEQVSLTTGAGNDTIITGNDNDTIYAGAGNDTINSGLGLDLVDGGDGTDTLIVDYSTNENTGNNKGIFSSNIIGSNSGFIAANKGSEGLGGFDRVTYLNIEQLNVTGTKYDDTIQGGIGNDILKGGAGNDRLIGNGGIDVLTGGAGSDNFDLRNYATQGNGDYALIKDFSPDEDRLILDVATTDYTVTNTSPITAGLIHSTRRRSLSIS